MNSSPLKKQFSLNLNTSKRTQTSFQNSIFLNLLLNVILINNQMQSIWVGIIQSKLERNCQSKLQLDDLYNQQMRKSVILHNCEMENLLLKKKIQVMNQWKELSRLQQIQLKVDRKTKFQSIIIKYFKGLNKKQQDFNESINNKDSNKNVIQIYKQDCYWETKQEKKSINEKFVEFQIQSVQQKQQIKGLQKQNKDLQNQIQEYTENNKNLQEQIKQYGRKNKNGKFGVKIQRMIKNQEEIKSRKSSDSQELQVVQKLDLVEELNEIKVKLQQLEFENQYLSEQKIEMQTQLQFNTDLLLKQ
ncbi:unnamed protein product [Paramecium sonneborni]|uniref:Uncharacterized protein n=1 Tax=Paramecium sonneborni TaxID=65129 RepID=A0A8S1PFJ8_9CILI|nr:unnamed protein product [Paramecium sonneborni]